MHQFLEERLDDVAGLALHGAKRKAEEQREHDDLQHGVGGQRLEDALGEDADDEVLEIQRTCLEVGCRARIRQRQMRAVARPEHIGPEQAQQQGNQRGGDEPSQRLGTHTAHALGVPHAGDAHHQRGEHQRGNDHLHQVKKDFRQCGEVARNFLGSFRGKSRVADVADDDAGNQRDQYPGGEFVEFHSVSVFSSARVQAFKAMGQ